MKKKILIASTDLGLGGIQISLLNLIKNLYQKKYHITLILEKKQGLYLDDLPNGIIVKEYNTCSLKNSFLRKIINFIKRIKWTKFNYKKYDTSICYTTYSGTCSFISRISSKKNILFVHSNYTKCFTDNEVKKIFSNVKIEKYNHIVFVSNESKKDTIKLYPNIKSKSIVINNLVDYKQILKLSEEKINIEKNNKKIFLFVGRLDETSKRLTLLFEVAKKSKKDKLDILFWIVGTGPDENKYRSIVEKENLDNVIFFGEKKNPYPYIKECDYLILTSAYEGFPVVYSEAIILNKPIITTINATDEFISIKDFGYVVNENSIYEKVKEISKTNKTKINKVDYKILNKKRIEKIESIFD